MTLAIKLFIGLASILILAGIITGDRVSAHSNKPQCEQKTTTVTLSPDNPTTYEVVGDLCYRGSPQNKTVQLLLHGDTYYKEYWDFPLNGQKYSFVRDQTKRGYVTFAIDGLGVGQSDRPPADQVTVPSSAYVAHQIIQQLKDGRLSGVASPKVVLVGHSGGSAVAMYEAVTYADVDGVILTGILHSFNPNPPYGDFFNLLYPASNDPKFANTPNIVGYFTTKPGVRSAFYNTKFAHPSVITLDEILKATVASGSLDTFFIPLEPGFTNQIDVPVLIGMGEKDSGFCSQTDPGLSCANESEILNRENSYYSAQACLEATVQPKAAHNTILHPNAHQFFDAASDWVQRRIGNGNTPPTQPCT